jgi:hypothetical protein
MRKLATIFIVMVIALSATAVVSADSPAPGGPFATAFRVQNLGGATANCTYQFFDSAGTAAFTSSTETVNPGDSLYVYTPSVGGLNAGTYSGVVSCDQPVAAVVNFSDSNSGASHSGVTTPGTTWYAPGIYDNYFDFYSNIVVQNATSGDVDVTVEIFEPGNAVAVLTQTENDVPANASVAFEQEGAAELDTGTAYSAKITATGNVAAIVNIYGRNGVENQLYSYNAFSGGATTFYTPIVMNNYYGNNTAISIQNIGASAANVTITYSDGTTKTTTIQPNSADSRYTPADGVASGDVNGLMGAQIESTNAQPIVVLVNMSNPFNRAASYNGFSGGSGSVRAPIVMKRYFTFNTSVVCQNIGGANTTMTLVYGGVGGSEVSGSIAPGSTFQFYQPGSPLISDGFIGSATITASEDIVCVVNEDANEPPEGTTVMDQQYSYNGIND